MILKSKSGKIKNHKITLPTLFLLWLLFCVFAEHIRRICLLEKDTLILVLMNEDREFSCN